MEAIVLLLALSFTLSLALSALLDVLDAACIASVASLVAFFTESCNA